MASGRRLSSTSSTRSRRSSGNLLVDLELAGVDDAHVQAGVDGVVEEGGVHRLADHVCCRGRQNDTLLTPPVVLASGKQLLEPAHRLDELDGVVVVFLHAGADGQDVHVEDDVARRKADFLGQQPIRAFADLDLAVGRDRLPFLVERHDDHGGPIAPDRAGLGPGTFPRLPSG